MGDVPDAIALDDQHGEPRRTCHRLAVLHARKFVEARNHYGTIVEYNGAPLAHCVPVPAAFQNGEVLSDSIRPFRQNGAGFLR